MYWLMKVLFLNCIPWARVSVVSMSGGMLVAPNYTVFDAPQPDVIVSPAHHCTPEIIEWLKKASVMADLTTSLCTGVYHLAEAGLLEGLMVTTFHTDFDNFANRFLIFDCLVSRRLLIRVM